jgi:PEGA domain-containing protein
MMRQKLSIGLVAAAFMLSLAPVWAQERERPSQGEPSSRPSNGESTGTAVPRGSSTASGSSSAPSSGGSATSSGGSSSSPSDSSSAWTGSSPIRERAPVRPAGMDRAERAEQRRGNGSGTTGRAVPRGESGNSGSTDSTSARSGSDSQPSQGRSRAVPTYSRPRDGRNPVGSAVERTTPRPGSGGGYGYIYDPFNSYYYNPYYSGSRYSYWSPFGYGYGLGYFSYDPFLFSGYGYGYPGSYGGGYGYDPYYGGSGGYSSRAGQGYREVGSLRLKVKPSDAQVYIDGYFVGVIDSYDGAFQRLSVEAGPHRVELKAVGFEPVQFEVMITPGETITYKGEMKPR